MKKLAFLLALMGLTTAHAQHNIDFDDDWVLQRRGTTQRVRLPRAWNEDDAFRVNNADLPTDTVRYVKRFRLPRSARGKRVFVEFEGARHGARVWLNGHYLGLHEDGITAFGFDLTPYLDPKGENRLEVLTDNSWDYREEATKQRYQWNSKSFNANYGGLPKHVRLHVLGDVYQTLPLLSSLGTTGVYVYATDHDIQGRRATVHAESEVRNERDRDVTLSLAVTVTDAEGREVARFQGEPQTVAARTTATLKADSRLAGLHFWSWGYGYLYDVRTRVVEAGRGAVLDEVVTRTGFRKTEFGQGMFRLNDRVLMVHGYAQRTSNEWPAVGMSVPEWMSDYSNGLMVESGGNLVRWMHIMPWRQDVESCDRVGLIQAMPAGDAEQDVEGRRWEQRVAVMRNAIVYNRNNPSIIFYECGNKGISEAHMTEMKALRDQFDPHGGRAIGSREMLGSQTAEYGGEMLYINKSARKPVWAMEYCRDEGLRRYWDDWSYPYHKQGDGPLYRGEPATAYNQNQDQLAIEHIRRWWDYWQVRPGTGRRVSSGGVKIVFSDTNTHCRGESNYRTSGVVDAMRLPKESFYIHQVMWDGWVEPEHPRVHVFGHNNYPQGTVKPLYVAANTDSVALLLNGQALPAPRRDYQYLFTVDSVTLEPGIVEAVGYNGGREVCRHRVETVGEPSALRLTLIGGDERLMLVEFEVVDAEGRRCPLDNRVVHFTVDGPGEWRGGIAKGEDNCILSRDLPVECGVNRALIRPTADKGTIRLTARAEGLGEVTMKLPIEKAKAATFRPLRGETPSTPSYRDVKWSVDVADVTAGCNQEAARNAVDDNEETEWKNDGRAQTAWVTYRFGKAERIDEINLKLTGWRRRSYPLEVVAADGTVVWQGETPMSLGYVTLPLTMARPSETLTIRLRGTATEGEAFGQVQELVQPVANELDLYKAKDGDQVRHELRIIETDFLRY